MHRKLCQKQYDIGTVNCLKIRKLINDDEPLLLNFPYLKLNELVAIYYYKIYTKLKVCKLNVKHKIKLRNKGELCK